MKKLKFVSTFNVYVINHMVDHVIDHMTYFDVGCQMYFTKFKKKNPLWMKNCKFFQKMKSNCIN